MSGPLPRLQCHFAVRKVSVGVLCVLGLCGGLVCVRVVWELRASVGLLTGGCV